MLVQILSDLQSVADSGDFTHYEGAQALEDIIGQLVDLADELTQSGHASIAADLRYVINSKE